MHMLGRRDFLNALATLTASVSLGVRNRGPALTFYIIDDGESTAGDIRRGAELAVEEARHAATMFGGRVSSHVRSGFQQDSTDTGISIVIDGAAHPAHRAAVMIAAGNAGAIYINVRDHDASLRAACRRHVFHVSPADTSPIWHPALTRFGADTLNKRFRARFGVPMQSAAWAGWFAVKCAWESALRSRATSVQSLVEYLEQPSTRFDGHKGAPLYFDPIHQLIQPLYEVSAEGGPPREAGTDSGRAAATCRWQS